jgi:ABC-2 type transport system ATP-binding protein
MHRGHVVADGSPTAIVEALGGAATVRFTDADLDVRPLRALPGVASVQRHGPEVAITGAGPILAHVGAHLVAAGRPALDLRLDRPTLEDRFVALTMEDPS